MSFLNLINQTQIKKNLCIDCGKLLSNKRPLRCRSCVNRRRVYTDETRKKMSEIKINGIKNGTIKIWSKGLTSKIDNRIKSGKEHPRYGIKIPKEKNPNYGRKYPKEKYPNMRNRKFTDEHKRNISKAKKGWKNPLKGKSYEEIFGKIRAQEIKKKIILASKNRDKEVYLRVGLGNKGKVISEENKEKLRYSMKEFWKKNRDNDRIKERNKKISKTRKRLFKEGKLKINKGMLGKSVSEKTKEKIKEARSKQKVPFKDSSIEIKIQNFLKQLGIEFYTHQYIKSIEHRYQCDILIPIMNMIIEVDGDYWHGNPQRYSKEQLNQRQKKQREMDELRTEELLERGYKVIRLWEDEIKFMDINQFKKKIGEINI